MKIKIHKGTREIGGSCVEVSEGKEKILVDMGLPLPGTNEKKVDARKWLPRLDDKYSGLFVSHSHPDHYGLVEFLPTSVPLCMGGATRELINISSAMAGKKFRVREWVLIEDRKPLNVGPFTVTPFLMDHSAMDAYAFLVESGGKRLFYSGDFRGHGRKDGLLAKLIRRPPNNIDALILEGTNISKERNSKSEADAEKELSHFFKEQNNGIILVMTSSQNLDRMVSLYKATIKTGRTLVLDTYTAFILHSMSKFGRFPHPSPDFKSIKVFFDISGGSKMVHERYPEIIKELKKTYIGMNEIVKLRNGIVMIARSSMARHFRKEPALLENGSLVWSMWEGYMKDARNMEFLDFLRSMGVSAPKVIHTSGHADIETLTAFARALDPKTIIPIHTMNPEKYKELLPNVRELNDGEELEV